MSKNPQNSEELMVAYVAGSEAEAYIVVGRLENEGIDAFVSQEPAGKAYGISIGEMGSVKVVVRASDYERAQAVLEEDVEDDEEEDLYEDDEDYDDADDYDDDELDDEYDDDDE